MFATILLAILIYCTSRVLIIMCSTEIQLDIPPYVFPVVNEIQQTSMDESTFSSERKDQLACSSAPSLEDKDETQPIVVIDLGILDCYFGQPGKHAESRTKPHHLLSTVGVRSDFSQDYGKCLDYSESGFVYNFVMATSENFDNYFIDFIRNIINVLGYQEKRVKLLIVGPELDYDNEIRRKMIERILETLNVSHVFVTKPSEMAMYALGKKNGIVIHSDGISTCIVPIVNGKSSEYLLRKEYLLVDHRKFSKFYSKNQNSIRNQLNASSNGISNLVQELMNDLGNSFPETVISGRSLSFRRMKEWKSLPSIATSKYTPEELVWMGACNLATSNTMERCWISKEQFHK